MKGSQNWLRMAVFLAIAFLLPLPCAFLRLAVTGGAGWYLLYGLEAASPSIAAWAVFFLWRCSPTTFGATIRGSRWYLALLAPLPLVAAPMVLGKAAAVYQAGGSFTLASLSWAQIMVAGWSLVSEEFGWRGYLQPVLREQFGPYAPLATGVVWGLWHYHFFLFSGLPVQFGLFLFGCIAESYLHEVLLHWTRQNLLASMVFHCAWDFALALAALNPQENGGSAIPYGTLVLAEWTLAGALLLFHQYAVPWLQKRREKTLSQP